MDEIQRNTDRAIDRESETKREIEPAAQIGPVTACLAGQIGNVATNTAAPVSHH